MKVTLHDCQDESSPYNRIAIENTDQLHLVLNQLRHRPPFILELEGENGFRLTVGIGGPVSCIQFAASDGKPPYLVAVEKLGNSKSAQGHSVFLCGNQDTEVPNAQCVPFTVLHSVTSHFVETGARSPEVDWLEI